MVKIEKALNVGCADVTRWIPGTEGLDIQDFGQKWVCSIFDFKPPYKYDVVFAHHFFEHFPDTIKLMNKIGSILKKGGILDIRVPTVPYEQAFVDPTHVKFIPSENFFLYFTNASPAGHLYGKYEFEIVGVERDRFEWELHVTMKKL